MDNDSLYRLPLQELLVATHLVGIKISSERISTQTRELPARERCGDEVGPALPELGTASENAGESYADPSIGAADTDAADEMTGLVRDGCVKLGEDVAADT